MFAINDANLDQYPQNLALKSTATKHRDAIHCVTFHPEKRCLLTGADYKRIIAWDSDTLQPIHKYKGHKGVISEICVIPGTDYVASASTDNTVKIWCLKTHKLIKTFQNHTASARFIRLVPYLNGNIRYLCSGGDDGKICFYRWNIQAKKFERTKVFTEKRCNKLNKMKERFYCFGANNTGNYVAIGGSSEFIYLYEIKNNGEINETLLKRPNKGKLNFLTFAFSHNTFVTGAEGKVNVCSLNNRKWKFVELDVIQHVEAAMRDKYQLNAAEWNRDDSYLFIMGNDKKIQIWKGTATNHVKTVEGHDKLAIFLQSHPKSRKYMFSSGRDGILKIWNVLAFNCVKTIHAFEDEKAIYDANISPDGKTIAIGGDRTVSVFSVGI